MSSYRSDGTASDSFRNFIVQEHLPEGDITPARHALSENILESATEHCEAILNNTLSTKLGKTLA